MLKIRKFSSLRLGAAALAVAGVGFVSVGSNAAHAQVNCSVVQSIGNYYAPRIVNALNASAAGKTYRINRRKKLRLNRVNYLRVQGCRVSVKAHVTLKRKIRRDAHGPVYMSGRVSSFRRQGNRTRICLSKLRVTRVKLSRTLRIGERFYKWIANKVIPRTRCFSYTGR